MKRIKYLFLVLILVIPFVSGCEKSEDNHLKIVSTVFPGYDFVRAIIGNDSNIKNEMLLSPGEEVHHFEPTPKDIINIKNCDLFIYVGGESDSWVDSLLDSIGDDVRIIKMVDVVDLVKEEVVEGMEGNNEELEADEHVWTDPINSIEIIKKIYEEIIEIDPDNIDVYKKNMDSYINELEQIDRDFQQIVDSGKRDELIFGDRFPLRYFTLRYNLKYYAAFPGCSDATEASGKTISFLIDKVKKDKVPVVLTIELSNKKIANVIAEETNTSVLEFNSCHNISKEDFDRGITYVDLMNKNKKVLKEALS